MIVVHPQVKRDLEASYAEAERVLQVMRDLTALRLREQVCAREDAIFGDET